ncbi:hypothetical protein scyTo_0009754 [Scyliorhinus torazame]|uniref:RING-type E3 ubiquitin transferase n=1 Tax=Scyliorhinus torazame TaxID=75743 RepID=A0A401NSX5_SCYTO|nr:hypothetical protein [Scyliorhinus torazame]
MRSAALLLALQWLWSAALAAAARPEIESAAAAAETLAEIEVVQYRPSQNGVVTNNSTLRLHGHFAGAGMRVAAEGKLLQFHPLWLCNTSEDEQQEYDFVSMVKLERPDRDPHPCLSLFNKAKFAIQRGASAVIFDVTDDASAVGQLKQNQDDPLLRPVILIQGQDAALLMKVININGEAIVKIHVKSDTLGRPAYDVGILMTLIVAFSVVVMILAVRIKCKQNRTRNSLQQQTINAISRLATRRYQSRCRSQTHERQSSLDSQSSSISEPVCAICLEEFAEGQDVRIISCFHEFHKECVDPWLLQHRTCPLCMYNIIEGNSSVAQHEVHDQANPAAQLNQRGESIQCSSFEEQRPKSLDSVSGPQEEQVLSHTHYHHHRHHHYGDAHPSPEEHCMSPGRSPSQKQENEQLEELLSDIKHCQQQVEFSCQSQYTPHPVQCHCLERHLLLPSGLCLPETSLQNVDVERGESRDVCAKPDQVPSENKPNRTSNRRRRKRRKRSFQMDQPVVYFHQDCDTLEDCGVHIHYGNSGRQCHLPHIQPSVPIPLILNNGASNEWGFPFCECPDPLCQQQRYQVGSEPQLAGEQHRNNMDPGHPFQDSCTEGYCDGGPVQDESFYCQEIPKSPGSESNVAEICEEVV